MDEAVAQPSDVSDNGMTWNVVTSGPYMDILLIFIVCPPQLDTSPQMVYQDDSTVVFVCSFEQA